MKNAAKTIDAGEGVEQGEGKLRCCDRESVTEPGVRGDHGGREGESIRRREHSR